MVASPKMAAAIAFVCLAFGLVIAKPHRHSDWKLRNLLKNMHDDLVNLQQNLLGEHYHKENHQRSVAEINMKHGLKDDIVYPKHLSKRAFMSATQNMWPKISEADSCYYDVPYELAGDFSPTEVKTIKDAIQTFHANSSIRFREDGEKDHYIKIVKENGCWSYVGKAVNNGEKFQKLSLGNGCVDKGTIQHEFLHALGFHHEQNRPDRDDYVKIHFENVLPDNAHNFDKQKYADVQGTAYDYFSVMHYGLYDFSNNGEKVIEVLDTSMSEAKKNRIGYANELSDTDWKELNLKYSCEGSTNPPKPSEVPLTEPTEGPGTNEPSSSTEPFEVDSTESPEVQSTESPEVYSTESPEVHSTEFPEVHSTEFPEVHSTEFPEVHSTEFPQVHSTEFPEVHSTEFPEVHSTEDFISSTTVATEEPTTDLIASCDVDGSCWGKGFKSKSCVEKPKHCEGEMDHCSHDIFKKLCPVTCGFCEEGSELILLRHHRHRSRYFGIDVSQQEMEHFCPNGERIDVCVEAHLYHASMKTGDLVNVYLKYEDNHGDYEKIGEISSPQHNYPTVDAVVDCRGFSVKLNFEHAASRRSEILMEKNINVYHGKCESYRK